MSKDYSLSLRGEAFNSLCADFDTTLRDVLAGMIETEQNTGEINIKVKITLTDDSAPDYTMAGGHQTREVTKPKFDHTVAYVIQRKEKKSGSFSGNFELVFDKASGQYFYRDIDNGQTTLFDGDGDSADFANTQYDVVDEGPRGLPAAPESSVIDGEEVGPADAEDATPDAAGEFEEKAIDPAHDPSKPFGWLRQFIGETMNVTEAMGNYTVRTQGNKVVLSSATSPENPFYCSAEKLSPHVGHAVVCVGYGDDEIVNIRSAILLNVQGVRSVAPYENATHQWYVDGTYLDVKDVTETPAGDIVRPPHSVEIVVDGGDSKEIAQQILANKAGGINTVGETVVVLPGEYDEEITIRFNRPTTIYTWFRLGITLNRSEALPPNYVDLLREVVLENMDALDAGKDVVPQQFMSQLYKACSGISYIDIQLYASADASDEKPSKYPDRSKNITARQRAYTKEEMIEVEIDG